MKKPYNLGIIVGRFQVLHLGHSDMINTALSLCDRVGVFIGSSQESGTLNNPFSYEKREEMLRALFSDSIEIYPLPDIGVGNNSKWGDYVLEKVKEHLGSFPDLIVSGKEGRRSSWLESETGDAVAELFIPKAVDISASRMRDYLISGDFESWKKYTDPRLWDSYGLIRETVVSSKDKKLTESI